MSTFVAQTQWGRKYPSGHSFDLADLLDPRFKVFSDTHGVLLGWAILLLATDHARDNKAAAAAGHLYLVLSHGSDSCSGDIFGDDVGGFSLDFVE